MFFSANGDVTNKPINKEGFINLKWFHSHDSKDQKSEDINNLKNDLVNLTNDFNSFKDDVSESEDINNLKNDLVSISNDINSFKDTAPDLKDKIKSIGDFNSRTLDIILNYDEKLNSFEEIHDEMDKEINDNEIIIDEMKKEINNKNIIINEMKDQISGFVNNNGNIGIGTNNPSKKLHVGGDTQIDGTLSGIDQNLNGGVYFPLSHKDFNKHNQILLRNTGDVYVGSDNDGEVTFFNGDPSVRKNESMKIKNGNVGIGNSKPLTKLQVGSAGYIRKDHDKYGTNDAVTIALPKASSNSVLNDPQDALILTRPGTSNQAWQSQAHMRLSRYENSGNNSRTRLDLGLLHNSGGTNQQGGAAPDNVMTLLSNGNVGVGTTAPSSTLDVNGSFKAKSIDVNGSFKAKSINPFEGNPSGKYYSRWSVGGVEKRIYHFVCYFKVDHRNIQTRLEIDFSMAYFKSKTGSHNRNQRSAGKVVLNIASNCPSNNGNPQSSRGDMKWFINYSSHGTHYVVSGQMGTGPGFYFLRKNDSCYILAAMGQSRRDGGSYNAMFKVSIMDPFLKEFRMFTDNATMKKNANIEPHLGQQSDPSNHKPDNYNSDFPGEYNFTNDDYGTWIKINGEGTKYQSFDNKLTNQTLG